LIAAQYLRALRELQADQSEEEARTINKQEESELESLLPGTGPSGDLHSLESKTADNGGSLPLELERSTPPPPANYPTLEDKLKPQVPQPIAVSLNAADPEEDYDDAALFGARAPAPGVSIGAGADFPSREFLRN
jgi:hypothetical protein